MQLFGFNITRSASPAVQKNLSPLEAAWLRGDDLDGQTGTVLSNAYEQSVWVYRAINVLAKQVANIPFLFSHGERGRENLITSGPLLDFYAHPHPQINRFQYWELRVIWLMLRGECFRIPIYEDRTGSNSLSPSDGERAGLPSIGPAKEGVRGRHLSQILFLDPAQVQHIVRDNELV